MCPVHTPWNRRPTFGEFANQSQYCMLQSMARVQSVEVLEGVVGARHLGVMLKSLDALDSHCVRLLGCSSFAVLGYVDVDGQARATAAGGPPGFATVVDATHLHVELPEPIALNPTVGCGLLFFIPGLGETLRVNGRAAL